MKIVNLPLLLFPLLLPAAVPLSWTVEASRVQPVAFDAVHGETLQLEAAFNAYGKPLEMAAPAALYYQTNGMGAAWWTAPATVSSNRIASSFTPAMDPGASRLVCFLGGTASTYRAAFTLRFAPNSPGATPNVLPLPQVSYDAALTGTPTINGTNLVDFVADRAETDPHAPAIVSNIVTRAYVEDLGISGGGGGGELPANYLAPATNYTDQATNALAATIPHTAEAVGAVPIKGGATLTNGEGRVYLALRGHDDRFDADGNPVVMHGGDLTLENGGLGDDGAKITIGGGYLGGGSLTIEGGYYGEGSYPPAKITLSNSGDGHRGQIIVDGNDIVDEVTSHSSQLSRLSQSVASTSNTVSQWTTYWDGDDVRVTVTNYYGSKDIPAVYLEQKIADSGTNYFKTVWDERTRWNRFLAPYESFTNAVGAELEQKADRAWGYYDSHTGGYAPDGYTWISSPKIAIAADLAYQKKITTEGAVWVLESNGLDTQMSGTVSNGFFRISDDAGNSLFEIVKGDKRTVGATAGSVTTTNTTGVTHLYIGYNVVGDHPTLYVCTDLKTADWSEEGDGCIANVTWTGESGAWLAEVWGKEAYSTMFVKATYEVGGNTYIKNNVAHSSDKVVIGGVEYTVKVETVDGRKLMVLE